MEKEFIVACFITVLFAVMKFIEMRYLESSSDSPPLKYIVRDGIKVFLGSWVGVWIFSKYNGFFTDFVNTLSSTPSLDSLPPPIFTDTPGF